MITKFLEYIRESANNLIKIKKFNRDTPDRAYIDNLGNYITLKDFKGVDQVHDELKKQLGIEDEYRFLMRNGWIKMSMGMFYFISTKTMTQSQINTLKKFCDAKGIKRILNGVYNKYVDVEYMDFMTPQEFTDYVK